MDTGQKPPHSISVSVHIRCIHTQRTKPHAKRHPTKYYSAMTTNNCFTFVRLIVKSLGDEKTGAHIEWKCLPPACVLLNNKLNNNFSQYLWSDAPFSYIILYTVKLVLNLWPIALVKLGGHFSSLFRFALWEKKTRLIETGERKLYTCHNYGNKWHFPFALS